MKIAINRCFGGFGLNEEVFKELGISWDGFGYLENKNFNIENDNPHKWRSHLKLISAIEKITEDKAGDKFAVIHIVDIPDNIEWLIDEYDGLETIHEVHRQWR